jgi:acetyl esterase/lipase
MRVPSAVPPPLVALVAPVALAVLAVGGCADAGGPDLDGSTGTGSTRTLEYLPGRAADVHLPAVPPGSTVPVVLLAPGGGWLEAERAGLDPLARTLAGFGMVVANATYRTQADAVLFPAPVDDVRCAAAFAVAQARAAGLRPERLVLVGHSAGGHLTALAAMADGATSEPCPYPAQQPDGLVGLAGVYQTAPLDYALERLFGVPLAEDPELWAAGDPVQRVRDGHAPPNLDVLLLHGDADREVPIGQSRAFAAALADAGNEVRLDVLPGITHGTAYDAEVAGPPIMAWLEEQRAVAGAQGSKSG